MMKRILVCAMAMAVTTMAVDFKGMDAPTKHVTPPKLELKGDRIELTIPKAFRDIAVRVVTHSLAAPAVTVRNPSTDWFSNAQFGAFMHYLPGGDMTACSSHGRFWIWTTAP